MLWFCGVEGREEYRGSWWTRLVLLWHNGNLALHLALVDGGGAFAIGGGAVAIGGYQGKRSVSAEAEYFSERTTGTNRKDAAISPILIPRTANRWGEEIRHSTEHEIEAICRFPLTWPRNPKF